MKKMLFRTLLLNFITLFLTANLFASDTKKIAYLVSDIEIPFWEIMSKGIKAKGTQLGYEVNIYSSKNIKKNELQNLAKILKSNPDGLIISPINSSTAVTITKLAKNVKIPVVISDIGSDSKDYVSFISSDNEKGAYGLGKVLAKKMIDLNVDKTGTVGIISIPQKRINGKLRTKGFLEALDESNIKTAGFYQQEDFSYLETYNFTMKILSSYPKTKAIWLQGSDKYKGAIDAIKDSNKKGEVLLICFDAEPIFLDLIPQGNLVASAMQQPYLMGQKAVETLDNHLNNIKVPKEQKLDVLVISDENIENELSKIKLNVLGIED